MIYHRLYLFCHAFHIFKFCDQFVYTYIDIKEGEKLQRKSTQAQSHLPHSPNNSVDF